MKFNEQLTNLRKEKGISQEALAEGLGVSRQAISKWETGATQPEMSNILRLCEILEVSPNELLCHEADVSADENTSQPTKMELADDQLIAREVNRTKKKGLIKAVIALLMILCFVSGIVLGIVIRSNQIDESTQQNVPMDFSVSGFDLKSEFSQDWKTTILRLTFTPNISNPEYEYKIVIVDGSGDSRQVDAETETDGVYSGTFYVTKGNTYMISVSMTVDGNTYSDALLKILDIDEFGYNWEEIED